MQNIGGNYTKLNIKWHTGIRFFAISSYGGVRFHSDVGMGTELMSIGNTDGHVRVTNNLYSNGTNLVFNVSNDGSGSGLDADLLDGQQGSYYAAANQTITLSGAVTGSGTTSISTSNPYQTSVTLQGSNGNSPDSAMEYQQASSITDTKLAPSGDWYNTIRIGHGDPYNYYSNTMAVKMTGTSVGQLYIQTISNNTAQGWRQVWDSSNDGAGSGLDADLLDGQQGSYYAAAASYLPLTGGTTSGTITLGTQKALVANNYGRGVYGLYSATKHQHVWSMGTAYNLADDGSGVGNLYGLSYTHTNIGTGYGSNAATGLGHQLNGRANGTLQWALGEGIWSAVTGNVWGASNDGSGSGLDADLLDGLQLHTGTNNEANKVVRTDVNGYINAHYINTNVGTEALSHDWTRVYASTDGYIRPYGKSDFKVRMGLTKNEYDRMDYSSTTYYHTGANSHNDTTFNGLLERGCGFIDNWNTGAGKPPSGTHFNGFQSLHYANGSSYFHGMQMVMSAGNPSNTYLRGWWANGGSGYAWQKIWTDGNDGSGSGLDADLLDGVQATSFLRSDAAATSTGMLTLNGGLAIEGSTIWNGSDTWCRIPGATGVYFSSYTGGVYMADTTWVRIYNAKALYVANEIAATGNITAYYSDERLKTKTGKIENALEKVQSLHGFTYVENDVAKSLGYKSEREQVAVSAQDVQRVLPQAVSLAPCDMETDEFSGEITSKSGEDYLTVDYSRLVPLLVEAIKELKEEVNGLKVQLGGK